MNFILETKAGYWLVDHDGNITKIEDSCEIIKNSKALNESFEYYDNVTYIRKNGFGSALATMGLQCVKVE